jgi:hypothetical protein
MSSILSTFPDYSNLGGYDDIYELGIYLKDYDKLEEIEVIHKFHPFIAFLKGFSQGQYNSEIKHGWFHKPTKIAKFYVRNPSGVGNLITYAWKEYANDLQKDEDIQKLEEGKSEEFLFKTFNGESEPPVSIYSSYCGSLYESNEFEDDKKMLYKNMINKLMDRLME